jgi:hypothetical protein
VLALGVSTALTLAGETRALWVAILAAFALGAVLPAETWLAQVRAGFDSVADGWEVPHDPAE